MVVFGYKQGHYRSDVFVVELVGEVEFFNNCFSKGGVKFIFSKITIDELAFQTHEKKFVLAINILVDIENISSVEVDKISNGSDDAFLIGAINVKYKLGHVFKVGRAILLSFSIFLKKNSLFL